ncbi:MAG: hypothetical protein Q4P32_09570, partial [Micrococcales bacterium]|nr:hypothetical protein [Micrococcales bacterium]
RRLHSSGRYRRIIVVGHSLGSVIGFDLLRCLWDEMRHPDPELAGAQRHIAVFDEAADRLDPGRAAATLLPTRIPLAEVPETSGPSRPATDSRASLRLGVEASRPVDAAELDDFQAAQFALWRGDRADGVPWLITDFVSLGSPFTYAPMLLDEPDVPFGGRRGLHLADLQGLKVVPRCPPIHDELEDSRFYTRRYRLPSGRERWLKVGHTAAPFGPTRWTNLYLPARGLLHGDLFAGPVADSFGPGVRDVPVRVPGRGGWASVRRCFPLSHLSYWWSPDNRRGGPDRMPAPVLLPAGDVDAERRAGDGRASTPETVVALVSAMRLDDIKHAPPHGPQPDSCPGPSPSSAGPGPTP